MQIDLNKLDPEKRKQVADLLGIDLDAPEEPKKRQPKKLPKILKVDQVEKLFRAMNLETVNGVKQRAIIGSLYKSALRISEISNMTVPDVDFAKRKFFVQNGKGGKDRYVPFGEELTFWLKEWDAIRPDSQWFFATRNGTQPDTRNIREMLYLLCKKAGIYIQDGQKRRLPNPHILRHTRATEWLNAGIMLPEVQELLGHEDISTTRIYLHIDNVALDKKIKDLG